MKNSLLHVLKLVNKDIMENYSSYKESALKQLITQFQTKILDLRKKDNQIQLLLQNLTTKELNSLVKKLNLNLLSLPKQKNKLISVLSGSILQEQKKNHLLKIAESLKSANVVKRKTTAKKLPVVSNYENLRKEWLTSKSPELLSSELEKINMNIIRQIVKPWNLKPDGRTKIALINTTINYIKRMRALSRLGK